MKTIKEFDLTGKTVLIRCDFNVPIVKGKIIDDTRIKSALKTIQYALSKSAKVVLLSHLGKVKEEKDKEGKSLAPIAKRLEELLGNTVQFLSSIDHEEEKNKVAALKEGEVLLLENTRFEDIDGKKESGNSKELSKFWASLGEVFINDAFATMHRAHASTVGIASYLPSGIGFLVEKEILALNSVFDPDKPFILILGGAKIKDKIGVIEKFASCCDHILIGGGMAFPFIEAEGYEIGASIKEEESKTFVENLIKKYPDKLILPVDFQTIKEWKDMKPTVKDLTEFEQEDIGVDIGPLTIELFKKYLKNAKTVLWNGPLGVYEFSSCKKGTREILNFLAQENETIKTVVGGGDTVACAMENKLEGRLYHLSTGGGATLTYLENETLVGLDAIQ